MALYFQGNVPQEAETYAVLMFTLTTLHSRDMGSRDEKIIQKMKKVYKVDTVKYSIEIDKEILGGIKVLVGNTIYDASIKTQLNQMF